MKTNKGKDFRGGREGMGSEEAASHTVSLDYFSKVCKELSRFKI